MSTNVLNPVEGRHHHQQLVTYLRVPVTHKEQSNVIVLGHIPSESLILSITVSVDEAFNGRKLKFGSTEDVNDYSEVDVSTVGIKKLTIANGKWHVNKAKELVLHAKLDGQVNAGSCIVLVQFLTQEK